MNAYQHTMSIQQFFCEYLGAEEVTQEKGVITLTFKEYNQGMKEKETVTITTGMEPEEIVNAIAVALRDVQIDINAYNED